MKETKSFSTLKNMSSTPFDLTQETSLTAQRIEAYTISAPHWSYLYGFERVDEKVLTALIQLADEKKVHEKMLAMQKGEKINKIEGFESENRAVLHTAMRDLFGSSPLSQEAGSFAELAKKEHEKLKKFSEEIDDLGQFSDAILVGIGGSELGPHALYDGLYFFRKEGRRVHFISNIDPDEIAKVRKELRFSKTLVIVVSKSGNTLETATNETILRRLFEAEGLDSKNHFISVTMPKSLMDDPKRYRACFYLFDCVGGRYSSTSMVGALLLAFACGYQVVIDLLEGAHEMDVHAREKDVRRNVPLMNALIRTWNRNFLQLSTIAVIPYAQVLARFPAHLQQCDMESNGKSIDQHGKVLDVSSGAVIWGEPGTSAQHSFFQLIHQGTDIIPVEFIGCRCSQSGQDFEVDGTTSQEKLLSNMFAQAIALAQGRASQNPNKRFLGNRPSSILLTEKLGPKALGALLALYEHTVAFQGFIWGINSFDQEGVQLGKVLAERCMQVAELSREGKVDGDFPLGSKLFEILKNE